MNSPTKEKTRVSKAEKYGDHNITCYKDCICAVHSYSIALATTILCVVL